MRSYEFILVFCISLILAGCSISSKDFKRKIDGVYIPTDLNDAISELDKDLPDSTKIQIKLLTENEFIGSYHFGLGLSIRNSWGLWSGSRLKRYFNQKGIMHPDDMSGIILRSYHRALNKKEIDLNEQIEYYKAYWKASKETSELVQLPKQSKHPSSNLQFGYAMWYNNDDKQKTSLIHIQTNSEIDSVWIYDYLFGWKKISENEEKELRATGNPESVMNKLFKKE